MENKELKGGGVYKITLEFSKPWYKFSGVDKSDMNKAVDDLEKKFPLEVRSRDIKTENEIDIKVYVKKWNELSAEDKEKYSKFYKDNDAEQTGGPETASVVITAGTVKIAIYLITLALATYLGIRLTNITIKNVEKVADSTGSGLSNTIDRLFVFLSRNIYVIPIVGVVVWWIRERKN